MTFTEGALKGIWFIDIAPFDDERGFFAITWSGEELHKRGLDPTLAQCNLSWNHTAGTIRGLHFQKAPFEEVKIVRCTRGAIYDVVVDLRPDSPTFAQWAAVELREDSRRMLYIPHGFAHGYQTLTDDAEIYYHVSAPYSPEHASGVRWNDSRFGIDWPLPLTLISERDAKWPDLTAKAT